MRSYSDNKASINLIPLISSQRETSMIKYSIRTRLIEMVEALNYIGILQDT